MSNILSRLLSPFSSAQKKPQKIIMNYFSDIKDLRQSLFLDFIYQDNVYQSKSQCLAFNGKIVRLALQSNEYLPEKNMTVACFFMAQKDKKKLPCNFSTKVLGSLKKGSSIYIDIAMPKEITHQQRRKNLRVPLTKSEISNFKVWAGREIPKTENEDTTKNKITWDPIEQEDFKLVDISAGGIKLEIAKESLITPKLQKNFLFLITGSFDAQNKTNELAMVARVTRISRPKKDSWDILGLQFSRWTKITEEHVTWIPTDDAGVSFLGTWLAMFMSKLAKSSS